jgi:hypothetical protein
MGCVLAFFIACLMLVQIGRASVYLAAGFVTFAVIFFGFISIVLLFRIARVGFVRTCKDFFIFLFDYTPHQ